MSIGVNYINHLPLSGSLSRLFVDSFFFSGHFENCRNACTRKSQSRRPSKMEFGECMAICNRVYAVRYMGVQEGISNSTNCCDANRSAYSVSSLQKKKTIAGLIPWPVWTLLLFFCLFFFYFISILLLLLFFSCCFVRPDLYHECHTA